MKRLRMIWATVLLVGLLVFSSHAETLAHAKQSVLMGRVSFDSARFPDSVLLGFFNDAAAEIAVLGSTNEAETTLAVPISRTKFALPARFYAINSITLNADPQKPASRSNKPSVIQYLPDDQMGKWMTIEATRPSQLRKWGDSLEVDRTNSGYDTITVHYFALPSPCREDTSTIDLPAAYLPLLKEYVTARCFARIMLVNEDKSQTEAKIALLEKKLLGRPADQP